MDLGKRIRSRLEGLEPRRLATVNGKNQAAVLMAITEIEERAHFLLTRRTETVATHKGQISFPGGVREAHDPDLITTALRETEEEIGLGREQVGVLGEFHDYWAITDHVVRTVVGLVPRNVEYRIHEGEVAYLLEVPLEFFVETQPRVEKRFHRGAWHKVYYFDFNGENIWGLTARMIKEFTDFLNRE